MDENNDNIFNEIKKLKKQLDETNKNNEFISATISTLKENNTKLNEELIYHGDEMEHYRKQLKALDDPKDEDDERVDVN